MQTRAFETDRLLIAFLILRYKDEHGVREIRESVISQPGFVTLMGQQFFRAPPDSFYA